MKRIALLLCLATCTGLASSQTTAAPPSIDQWGGVKISETDSLKLENAMLKIALAAQIANQQYTTQAAPYLDIRAKVVADVLKANPEFVWDAQHSIFVKKQVATVAPPKP